MTASGNNYTVSRRSDGSAGTNSIDVTAGPVMRGKSCLRFVCLLKTVPSPGESPPGRMGRTKSTGGPRSGLVKRNKSPHCHGFDPDLEEETEPAWELGSCQVTTAQLLLLLVLRSRCGAVARSLASSTRRRPCSGAGRAGLAGWSGRSPGWTWTAGTPSVAPSGGTVSAPPSQGECS